MTVQRNYGGNDETRRQESTTAVNRAHREIFATLCEIKR